MENWTSFQRPWQYILTKLERGPTFRDYSRIDMAGRLNLRGQLKGTGCLEFCGEKDSEVVLGLHRKNMLLISEVCNAQGRLGHGDVGEYLPILIGRVRTFRIKSH